MALMIIPVIESSRGIDAGNQPVTTLLSIVTVKENLGETEHHPSRAAEGRRGTRR